MYSKCVTAFVLLAAPALAHADAALQTFLEETLAAARDESHLPAVAALIRIDGKTAAEAALGVRAEGHPELVTKADRWHIGSDTKAFTATLIARLVERHVMSFDDTLAASFPAFAKDMDPAYREITVLQLLSHTAGLPALTSNVDLPPFLAAIHSAEGVTAQRIAVARKFLAMPPASKAGQIVYSNLGFIIAGAIAEARTGKPWEALIREEIFTPLGIVNAGFGPPGTSSKIDQPRGHSEVDGKLVALDPADPDSDNPPALGPAGTINITLADWMLFAQDQLDGEHGHGKLLKPEGYRKLHTPVTENYALGWGVRVEADGTPLVITHAGSNGYWLAVVRIGLKDNTILLIATNAGNAAANAAIGEAGSALVKRFSK
jgi:D-alanyl-D-alanine carboxypeptidase